MITDEQRQNLRNLIMEEIQKLEESLESLKERAQPVSLGESIGRLSRMDSMIEQGTAGRLLADSQQRLSQLRSQLAKIDGPSYGVCARCHQPISFERLEAVPDAVVCIECARGPARR